MIGSVNTGGGGKTFAYILAIYTEGSDCTCSNGVKTKTAKDQSGSYLFSIPASGVWTVTATDGTNTRSSSIVVSEAGRVYEALIPYEIILYKPGMYLTDFNIGFNNANIPVALPENATTKIYFNLPSASSTSRRSWICTKNFIDLTSYSQIVVQYTHTRSYAYNGSYTGIFVILDEEPVFRNTGFVDNSIASAYRSYTESSGTYYDGTWTIDVSEINEFAKIVAVIGQNNSGSVVNRYGEMNINSFKIT